jgi:hypothetical protein
VSAVVSVLKRSIELRVGVMRAHGHPSHLRSREAPRPASVHASVPLFLQPRHSATVTDVLLLCAVAGAPRCVRAVWPESVPCVCLCSRAPPHVDSL